MTLDRLVELTCKHFGVTDDEFRSKNRQTEDVSIARHCFRAVAYDRYGNIKGRIAKYEGKTHPSILHSINLILKDNVFKKEYSNYILFLSGKEYKAVQIAKDPNGIERITNDAFDERLYKHPTRINERTGEPYFPAYHFLTQEGEPTPYGLLEWYKQMGYKSNEILERSRIIGSFVHDSIDRMIKSDSVILQEEIHAAFPHAKEALKVKECLLGFMNFMTDEEPIVLACEAMVCGDDFGFTLDNKFRLKSDKYKKVWTSDWKTAKSASESHKTQVETMRRVSGGDRGMVVILGNQTKKKYTVTKIPEGRHDYYWDKFLAIKETAYVEILDKGRIKPREDNMPMEFCLKDVKFKRKL